MRRGLEEVPQRAYAVVLELYLEVLKARLKENLVAVILYGSVARGDAQPPHSDIDLYIVARQWPRFFDERFKILDGCFRELSSSEEWLEALSSGLRPRLSEYPLTMEEASRHGPLDLEVYADGIVLYDPENFSERKFGDLEAKLRKSGARRIDLGKGKRIWVLKPEIREGEVIEI